MNQMDSEGADQTERMCRLIWAFVVCICIKGPFFHEGQYVFEILSALFHSSTPKVNP